MIRRSRIPPPKSTRKLLSELHDVVRAYETAKGPITRACLADTLIHWMPRVLELLEGVEATRLDAQAKRRAALAEARKVARRKS